jgi:hypothetical protein
MSLQFPSFEIPFLQKFTAVGIAFDAELAARYGEHPVEREDAQYGDGHWVRLFIGPSEGSNGEPFGAVEFEFQFVRRFGPNKRAPTMLIDHLQKHADEMLGKSVALLSTATFVLGIENRPKHGLVSAMFGVSVKTDSEKLTLTGARLSNNEGRLRQIGWSLRPDDSLEVKVESFRKTMPFHENAFIEECQFLRDSFDRFIVGQDENQND